MGGDAQPHQIAALADVVRQKSRCCTQAGIRDEPGCRRAAAAVVRLHQAGRLGRGAGAADGADDQPTPLQGRKGRRNAGHHGAVPPQALTRRRNTRFAEPGDSEISKNVVCHTTIYLRFRKFRVRRQPAAGQVRKKRLFLPHGFFAPIHRPGPHRRAPAAGIHRPVPRRRTDRRLLPRLSQLREELGMPAVRFDVDEYLAGYASALLVATKIVPETRGIPISESGRLIRPERLRLEARLLEMERLYGGRSFAYVGTCLHCPEGSCTRPAGNPAATPTRSGLRSKRADSTSPARPPNCSAST